MKEKMKARKKRRINLLPNIITAFGLACGLFVVFKVNMTGFGTYELLYRMSLILLIAAIADVLDGAIARAMRATSEFGFTFDSLADAVSFGVAPSILFIKAFTIEQGSPLAFIVMACAMIYTVCGILRLVRFNVLSFQKKEDKPIQSEFIGLPIPAGAFCVISPNLLLHSPFIVNRFSIPIWATISILCLSMLIAAYLMLSRLRFPSLKSFRLKATFGVIFWWILLASFILFGLFYYYPVLLVVVSWGYVLFSLGYGLFRRPRKRTH